MNNELRQALREAHDALQRIATLTQTRLENACANLDCPDNNPRELGRQGRCYSCWRYKKLHGTDRTRRYQRGDD